MIKFEKRFLYTFADVEDAKKLIGKEGLFFDSFILDGELINKELFELLSVEQYSRTESYKNSQNTWRFFYYDPNLECKRAYYLENKKIQVKNILGNWETLKHEPQWNDDTEYRIEPETEIRLTNREVAEWLAKGNGEILILDNMRSCILNYSESAEKLLCEHKIRKWSDTEWHEATREYIEGDNND